MVGGINDGLASIVRGGSSKGSVTSIDGEALPTGLLCGVGAGGGRVVDLGENIGLDVLVRRVKEGLGLKHGAGSLQSGSIKLRDARHSATCAVILRTGVNTASGCLCRLGRVCIRPPAILPSAPDRRDVPCPPRQLRDTEPH